MNFTLNLWIALLVFALCVLIVIGLVFVLVMIAVYHQPGPRVAPGQAGCPLVFRADARKLRDVRESEAKDAWRKWFNNVQ